MDEPLDDQPLLTLVDHGKPFKGTWQVFHPEGEAYLACHTPADVALGQPDQLLPAAYCCRLDSRQQACVFTGELQRHGWSIEGNSPLAREFRQACAL